MAEKRKRGQNFSLEEKDKLVKLLLQHKNTILNKKTDGSTNEAKMNSWIQITNSFNSCSSIPRSKESLMKVWEKLKSDSKMYYSNNKRSTLETGGGPSVIKIDPVLDQVSATLGRGCTGILGVADCDSYEEALPKVICVDNSYDNEIVVEDMPLQEPNVIIETTEKQDLLETNTDDIEIKRTPLWSRRRPQVSSHNERSEAISSLYASFQGVNKRKENIEEYKLKLLQNELEFKEKIQDIQLQIAMKELEIKTTVLEQIKGGGLTTLKNIYETQEKHQI